MAASAVGLLGRVVTRIRGGELPGEVRVVHGGMPHDYLAFAEHPLPVGADVLVIATRGARQLVVEPWTLDATTSPLDLGRT